ARGRFDVGARRETSRTTLRETEHVELLLHRRVPEIRNAVFVDVPDLVLAHEEARVDVAAPIDEEELRRQETSARGNGALAVDEVPRDRGEERLRVDADVALLRVRADLVEAILDRVALALVEFPKEREARDVLVRAGNLGLERLV